MLTYVGTGIFILIFLLISVDLKVVCMSDTVKSLSNRIAKIVYARFEKSKQGRLRFIWNKEFLLNAEKKYVQGDQWKVG